MAIDAVETEHDYARSPLSQLSIGRQCVHPWSLPVSWVGLVSNLAAGSQRR